MIRINKYTPYFTNQLLLNFRHTLTRKNTDDTRIYDMSKYLNPTYQTIMNDPNTINNFIVQIEQIFQIINVECKQHLKQIFIEITKKLADANNINFETLINPLKAQEPSRALGIGEIGTSGPYKVKTKTA